MREYNDFLKKKKIPLIRFHIHPVVLNLQPHPPPIIIGEESAIWAGAQWPLDQMTSSFLHNRSWVKSCMVEWFISTKQNKRKKNDRNLHP